jgi:hypothetical protein
MQRAFSPSLSFIMHAQVFKCFDFEISFDLKNFIIIIIYYAWYKNM